MAEGQNIGQEGSAQPAAKLKSVGTPQPASFADIAGVSGGTGEDTSASGTTQSDASQAGSQAGSQNQQTPPKFSEADFKAYLAEQGIEFEGDLNSLKEKLKPVEQKPAEPTAEEKAKAEAEMDRRMLELYLNNKGKAEDYVAIKALVAADPKDISLKELKKELKDSGFSETEIDLVIQERYFQLDDDTIAQYDDESDRAFAQRKKSYGDQRLAARGESTRKQAEGILNSLREAVLSQDSEAKQETEFSSKVDEQFSKLPRKMEFELGLVNDQSLAPLTYEVSDTELAEAAAVLKDPTQRKQFLYHQDGSLNLENLSSVLLRNKILETALKAAVLEGGSRQLELLKQTFPDNPHVLGVGGSAVQKPKKGEAGKLAGFGKPQLVTGSPRK